MNAFPSMVVREEGMVKFVSFEHPMNTLLFIVVMFEGMDAVSKAEQSMNALDPIDVAVVKVTVSSLEHPLNALSPIVVTPEYVVTFVRDVQLRKA